MVDLCALVFSRRSIFAQSFHRRTCWFLSLAVSSSPSCSLSVAFSRHYFSAGPCLFSASPMSFKLASEGRTPKLLLRPLHLFSTLFFAFILLGFVHSISAQEVVLYAGQAPVKVGKDRKSTRLNSSHPSI